MTGRPLRVVVVDDEQPALAELAYLLGKDDRIGSIISCVSASEALRILNDAVVDAIFLDVAMPGLSGLELATVLARFKEPPPVVFVTAYMEHAVEAFDLAAVDYLLKPVREERLREAVRRVCEAGAAPSEDTIPVELGGVARFVQRSDCSTSRRRATTHVCTRPREAIWSGCRSAPWRSAGAVTDSCASTVHFWSPSPTSTRFASRTVGARSWLPAPN